MNLVHEQEKIIYLVRHGQSTGNISPVFQTVKSPLTDIGIMQAESIADRLSRLQFEALIASPVRRAKETAIHIGTKTGKAPIYSDLFVECVKPSSIDGKSWADKDARDIWYKWQTTLFSNSARYSDGENFEDIVNRVDKALKFLYERPEQKIVVVTHGFFLRSIIARILIGDELTGPIMKRFQQLASVENTGITVLQYKDAFEEDFAWRLWTFNDHSHFAD